jgi:hypothetical protein
MSDALRHFSQHRLNGTTLQVAADEEEGLARLIDAEIAVIRAFSAGGGFPHRRVTLFVLADLAPLAAQIERLAAVPAVVARELDSRPMVNVYDAADTDECTVFVNRSEIVREGLWQDGLALTGLLAHEHGHPVGECPTVAAARRLSLAVRVHGEGAADTDAATHGFGEVLSAFLGKLSVRAPQEVFANEAAIRVGLAEALARLDESQLAVTRAAVAKRPELVAMLDRQLAEGRLVAGRRAALLLVGDMQATLLFALETAPFIRAGRRDVATRLEAALVDGILSALPAPLAPLYHGLRDHYLALGSAMTATAVADWCRRAALSVVAPLHACGLDVEVDVVAAVSDAPEPNAAAAADGVAHRGGACR